MTAVRTISERSKQRFHRGMERSNPFRFGVPVLSWLRCAVGGTMLCGAAGVIVKCRFGDIGAGKVSYFSVKSNSNAEGLAVRGRIKAQLCQGMPTSINNVYQALRERRYACSVAWCGRD